MAKNYEDYFPFDSIRDQQREAVDFCLENFLNNNKRFCIVEAGTGVGKSAIGLTLSRVLSDSIPLSEDVQPGGYFVTTQKILQQQYVNDFPTMVSLKSSSNYQCRYHSKNTCAESQQMLRSTDKSSKFFKTCVYDCTYKNQKQRYLDSAESITNFSYFLAEANYSGKITPRQVLVVDEGHNIETALSKFVEISISEFFSDNILKLRFPKKLTQYQVHRWIKETYLPTARSRLAFFEKSIEKFGGDKLREKLKQFQSLTRKHDLLKSHVSKIKKFISIYNSENWVFEAGTTPQRGYKKVTFKPIDISQYAEDYLFSLGQKVIIMSATIMSYDIFRETLGLPKDQTCFISLPSPFPIENRPIIFSPVGSMGAKSIDSTLPNLANAIREILNHHVEDKGIIHCKTYKIARYISHALKDPRIITHDSTNRDEALERHSISKERTVLLSPSMSEGVDLKDDISRFQIICKVPYPYLGDKLIRKRMNRVTGWYELQTAKLIVQSVGRSVRSESDHAATYILDSDFERFLNRNRSIFSEDFKLCLVK